MCAPFKTTMVRNLALLFAALGVTCASQLQGCPDVQAGVDLSGFDCCGGKQTLNSTGECCEACQLAAGAGCQFWTYDAGLKHCYLKVSDAGRRASAGHVSGSAGPPPTPPPAPSPAPSPNATCSRAPEPPSPHPPLPAGHYRFPYNSPYITPDAGDGCPDVDLDRFDNGAEACPAAWRDECTATAGSDEDVAACECGSPRAGGKHRQGCYQCIGQPHHLERKPCNVTAWKANDLCARYPPITRRQILERALGWVSNGFLYGTFNASNKGGTPETCSSMDEAECPQYSYESVCNGLLEMAWKTDDTNTGPGKKKTWPPTKIDCLDVKPGDWLHTGHHMQMFRRWLNGTGGIGERFVLYQMGGGWGKANAVVATFSKGKYGPCYRRPNIVGDQLERNGTYCSAVA